MKQFHSHSRSSLFLAELILALCFLALVCAGCVRLFAAAYLNRTEARRLNYIQENTIQTGELLEGWSGEPNDLSALFPEASVKEDRLLLYYDKNWSSADEGDHMYCQEILPSVTENTKGALVSFTDAKGEELYRIQILYPLTPASEGGTSA